MQVSETEDFKKIWIITPFLHNELPNLESFLESHKWFLTKGGKILLKSDGRIDQKQLDHLIGTGIVLIQKPDISLYDAWNQGMDFLLSINIDLDSYITFLGLDDRLSNDFCRKTIEAVKNDPKIDFIYGNGRSTLNGRYKDLAVTNKPALFNGAEYVFDVLHPGLMNRWSTIRDQRFDINYRLAADLDFYIGITQRQQVIYKHLSVIQAIIGADGVSNNAKALNIYINEWTSISKKRGVFLRLDQRRMYFLRILSKFPRLFFILRRGYWSVTAKKL